MSNAITVYSAGDYAGIGCNGFKAYYGYEKTDEADDWCFEADMAGKIITIPFSKLGVRDMFDCQTNLLYGIAVVLNGVFSREGV